MPGRQIRRGSGARGALVVTRAAPSGAEACVDRSFTARTRSGRSRREAPMASFHEIPLTARSPSRPSSQPVTTHHAQTDNAVALRTRPRPDGGEKP